MMPEVSFERIREQVRNDLFAMVIEDQDRLDELLMVLQPKMEANVQRRRQMEKKRQQRSSTKKKIVEQYRKALRLLWTQIKSDKDFWMLCSRAHEENDFSINENDDKHQDQVQKEKMNNYLKRIGCPLRVL